MSSQRRPEFQDMTFHSSYMQTSKTYFDGKADSQHNLEGQRTTVKTFLPVAASNQVFLLIARNKFIRIHSEIP